MSRLRRWLRRSPARSGAQTGTHLDRCPDCAAGFVYPVIWAESGPAHWWLVLRCGACGSWRDVVASNYAVAVFDRLLDEARDVIRATAERLEHESFSAEADTFGTALRLDLLTADDFR